MSSLDGTEPIHDGEILFRRIPVSQNWYDPSIAPFPSPQAFRPRDDDITGLSLVRGQPYNTLEEAARGPARKGYYVAVLTAGDLRKRRIQVVPRPVPGISGHAEIPDLTAANWDTDAALTMMATLAHELCLRVEGPFLSQAP
jgi:hypothetical protein